MPNALQLYQEKRDFTKTAEPSGARVTQKAKKAAKALLFVIHKHAATRLHYDLRLEHDGVLWSWAVTRGPSLNPADKRLAVHVEDHPLDYGAFEGEIPRGSYGAGQVIVWDSGSWLPEGDASHGMEKGHLSFTLFGEKLAGKWHLVRLKPRQKEKRDNWLLMKAEDGFADLTTDIIEAKPQSVKSGLRIEDIGARQSNKPKSTAKSGQRRLSGSMVAAMPEFVPPALATLKSVPPTGKEWLHEVKFDGYRIQAHVAAGQVKLLTRSGLNWTTRFGPYLAKALTELDCSQTILDGELVVLSPNGVASFSLLQEDLSNNKTDRMVFYAFDILHIDNQSMLQKPLEERKRRLQKLLENQSPNSALRFSEDFDQSGEAMLEQARRLGLEGIVSKRREAPYQSGRSFAWIKTKCTLAQEFIILGYLPSDNAARGLRSLLVGFNDKGALEFVGRVGTGFTTKSIDVIKRKLDTLKVAHAAIAGLEKIENHAVWVRPELVAEVEFRAWTADGLLRQASFKGLREDKPPAEIVKEVPDMPPAIKVVEPMKKSRRVSPLAKTSITLSHPDKLLWPKAQVSKQNALDYYAMAWERMKPFIINRPLSLVRAPDGVGHKLFFQKHATQGQATAIRILKDPADKTEILYIDNFDGLAALVQLGVVEIHIWGSTINAIETPDQLVFDLDPDEGLGVAAVRDAAHDVNRHLQDLGFKAFLKTSGGKGFHIVVPLKPKTEWEEVKTFAHDFARAMAQSEPKLYTAALSKKARKGKIFIDYLRNGRGSTTVAPYSLRANEQAAISLPITWAELEKVTPNSFQIGAAATLDKLGSPDPWKDFFKNPKTLRS